MAASSLDTLVLTSRPTSCAESWWVGKARDEFYSAWRRRVPLMKITKATAFQSATSGKDE